jgi:hypothetical protein
MKFVRTESCGDAGIAVADDKEVHARILSTLMQTQ